MRIFGMALAIGLATAALQPVFAADNPQQNRMKECNSRAADKKGEERKGFMKECLAAQPMSQQDKMRACNTKATGMKGDERKKFMSNCLSA